MISRRNYFTSVIIMAIVLLLFQFSNIALEAWNPYEENSYIVDTSELPTRSDSYSEENAVTNEGRKTIVYIGAEEGSLTETIALWATYTKRSLITCQSLEECETLATGQENSLQPGIIAIDSDAVDWSQEKSCELLEGYVQSGTSLIFCNLPEASLLKENQRLQELLGIQRAREENVQMAELHLYEGFLLGGDIFYSSEGMEEGMNFALPWYVVSDESEIYMSGIPEEEFLGTEVVEEKELPAVIWKKNSKTASVFAVNGDYMEDLAGLGILSAMSAKMDSYEIYPVVNAQNVIYANYPSLADENKEYLTERYSQSLESLYQNVIWPDMVAVRRESRAALSCMLAPQLDYEDDNVPDAVQFQRYMKLLNEQRAETGLSGTYRSDTPIGKKMAEDDEFMQEALPTYQFTSFYADRLTDEEIEEVLEEDLMRTVRTVVEDCNDNKEVIGYLSEYVTRQSAVIDGLEDSVRHNFRIRCLETALGYSSILIDLGEVIYPEEDAVGWVPASHTLRQNISDYQIGKWGFDSTTVSECDERIRRFLALDYRDNREADTIRLERNDTKGSVWFVLRTNHEEIDTMEGGSWQQLEEDAYLIRADQERVEITLKAAR